MFGHLYIPVAQKNNGIGLISFRTVLSIENLETFNGFAKLYIKGQLVLFDTFNSVNSERYKAAMEVFYSEYVKDNINYLRETNDELQRNIASDILMKT